jgi:hypothetical protein
MEPPLSNVDEPALWTDRVFIDVLKHHILDILASGGHYWLSSMIRIACRAWYEALPLPAVFFSGSLGNNISSVLPLLEISHHAYLKSIDSDTSDHLNTLIAKTTLLKTLHMSLSPRAGITPFMIKFSECLAKNESIRELVIDWGNLRDVAKYEFAMAMRENKTLRRLKIRGSSTDLVDLMSAMSENSTLEELDLRGMRMDDDGAIATLCVALQSNSSLRKLNLSSAFTVSQDPGRFADIGEMLKKNSTLTHLDVSMCYAGNDSLMFLADGLKVNTSIRYLDVRDTREDDNIGASNDYDDDWYPEPSRPRPIMAEFLMASRHIETLLLPSCDSASMAMIAAPLMKNAESFTKLRSLKFGFLGLKVNQDETDKFFASLSLLPSLTELHIDELEDLAQPQPRTIAFLSNYVDANPRLNVLGVCGVAAPGDAYNNLFNSLAASNVIERLHLAHIAIEPEVLVDFADFCKNTTSLKELRLRSCHAQSAAQFVSAICASPSLVSISLWRLRLESSGIFEHLSIPRSIPTLTSFSLSIYTIRSSDVDALASALCASKSLTSFEIRSVQSPPTLEALKRLESVPARCEGMEKLVCNGKDLVAAHRRTMLLPKADKNPTSSSSKEETPKSDPPQSPRDSEERQTHKKEKCIMS